VQLDFRGVLDGMKRHVPGSVAERIVDKVAERLLEPKGVASDGLLRRLDGDLPARIVRPDDEA
jgi:hypothetical protein